VTTLDLESVISETRLNPYTSVTMIVRILLARELHSRKKRSALQPVQTRSLRLQAKEDSTVLSDTETYSDSESP
jgi:hypothetical protein